MAKDNLPKKIIGLILVALVVAAALVYIRRGNDDVATSDVPVYGPVEDTGFVVVDEEVGVFEDAASEDVITMPPLEEQQPGASSLPRAPAERAAPPQPPVNEASRQRAEVAIPRYETALATKQKDPLLLNNYAWSLHQAGRYREAEQRLREVISIAPNRAIAYANLGESLWKQGKNEEAAAMYRKFLAMNSDPARERIAEAKVAAITGVR